MTAQNTLYICKTREEAIVPSRGSMGSAGLDLFCMEDITVRHNNITTVNTGISVQLPFRTVGLIWPRSGHAKRNGIQVLGGVIDWDYRGAIQVMLTKSTQGHVTIARNTAIAQMIIQDFRVLHHVETDTLDDTERDEDGFGSSDW